MCVTHHYRKYIGWTNRTIKPNAVHAQSMSSTDETENEPDPIPGWVQELPEAERAEAMRRSRQEILGMDERGEATGSLGPTVSPEVSVGHWTKVRESYERQYADAVLIQRAGMPSSSYPPSVILSRLVHAQRNLEAARKHRDREAAKAPELAELERLRQQMEATSDTNALGLRPVLEARIPYFEKRVALGMSGKRELRETRSRLDDLG